MPNVKQYWADVRAIEWTLPEFPFLTSLDDPTRGLVGGRVVQMSRERAAQMIHERRFRLSTEEEIAAHEAESRRRQRAAREEELRKAGIVVAVVPPEERGRKAKRGR